MSTPQNEAFSVKKRLKSFIYAFRGVKHLFGQHNAWIHSIAAITALLLGFLLKISTTEWCIIIISIGLVFSSELFNTSIEKLTDMVSPEHNTKAAMVKDMAAGAVLFMAMAAACAGLIIFLPKIWELLTPFY
ncbi:MAG: diacylglycerol kinase family protein [Bacteroidales bacterium]|nr:diacylglycerol kinase family protein [Bacteroidales bacterium]